MQSVVGAVNSTPPTSERGGGAGGVEFTARRGVDTAVAPVMVLVVGVLRAMTSATGWTSDPLFYPAKPPAHWLMCAEIAGRVLVVPLAPARNGDPRRCRPIGCNEAAPGLATQYRRDR